MKKIHSLKPQGPLNQIQTPSSPQENLKVKLYFNERGVKSLPQFLVRIEGGAETTYLGVDENGYLTDTDYHPNNAWAYVEWMQGDPVPENLNAEFVEFVFGKEYADFISSAIKTAVNKKLN